MSSLSRHFADDFIASRIDISIGPGDSIFEFQQDTAVLQGEYIFGLACIYLLQGKILL